MTTFGAAFERLYPLLLQSCRELYGPRLLAVVVFGSVARGTAGPDSDLDILIVADPLPPGRVARVREFGAVETALEPQMEASRREGLFTRLSPVFKTRSELDRGSPLFLDMVEDAQVLYDPQGVFSSTMARLRQRLAALGARRVWRDGAWYWDLKPDYRCGDVFSL